MDKVLYYQILQEFIQGINEKNILLLERLMTEEHLRISKSSRSIGKTQSLHFWANNFKNEPNYRIEITSYVSTGNEIAFLGIATGCKIKNEIERDCHILVKAKIENGKFSYWNQLIEETK